MPLPVPNLDDRRFQDIVDEAKRLIPTYCPEWTNHNLSDPGVALIELFAWMTELLIFRLGRPDVLPVDDYGIRKGYARVFKKRALPTPRQLEKWAEPWRPYRTVASWYLWKALEP